VRQSIIPAIPPGNRGTVGITRKWEKKCSRRSSPLYSKSNLTIQDTHALLNLLFCSPQAAVTERCWRFTKLVTIRSTSQYTIMAFNSNSRETRRTECRKNMKNLFVSPQMLHDPNIKIQITNLLEACAKKCQLQLRCDSTPKQRE